VSEDERGQQVRCKECDKRISVPEAEAGIQQEPKVKAKAARQDDPDDEEEEDERPVRKQRKQGGNGSTFLLLLLGGGALALCLLCGVGGVVAVFLVPGVQDRKAAAVAVVQDRKRRGPNQDFNLAAKGKVIFNQTAKLIAADPLDPTPELKDVNARMKVHPIAMQPGKTYVITMDSDDFDAYLRVESPAGVRLAEDDDSGGDLNAKIVFRPTEAGMFRVIATTWDGELGQYRLKIQEAN
jgi:hypothetical protein